MQFWPGPPLGCPSCQKPEYSIPNYGLQLCYTVISSLPAKGTGSWGGCAETHTSSTVSSVYPLNDKSGITVRYQFSPLTYPDDDIPGAVYAVLVNLRVHKAAHHVHQLVMVFITHLVIIIIIIILIIDNLPV